MQKALAAWQLYTENNLIQLLPKSQKTPNRIMYLTIHIHLGFKKTQILNTHAPQMGYCQTENIKYWAEIEEVLQQVNQKQFLIWATDNNGQIEKTPGYHLANEIGTCAYAEKYEKEMGGISEIFL